MLTKEQVTIADRLSYVRHAASVGSHYGRKVGLMVMLRGYFEDSAQGKPKPAVMVVAGFVSSVERWEGFESEWKEHVLDRFGLSHFRMSDCLTHPPRGPFKNLTSAQCDEAAFTAMLIIGKWIDAGMGTAVIVDHFKDLIKYASKKRHPFIRNAYSFCFFSTVEHLIRTSEGELVSEGEKIAAYFDQGSIGRVGRNWEKFKRTMDPKDHLAGVTFDDDQLLYPLQAADAVAHLSCKLFLCRQFP